MDCCAEIKTVRVTPCLSRAGYADPLALGEVLAASHHRQLQAHEQDFGGALRVAPGIQTVALGLTSSFRVDLICYSEQNDI